MSQLINVRIANDLASARVVELKGSKSTSLEANMNPGCPIQDFSIL